MHWSYRTSSARHTGAVSPREPDAIASTTTPEASGTLTSTSVEAMRAAVDAVYVEENQKLDKLAQNMDDFVRDQPAYDIEAELAEAVRQQTPGSPARFTALAQSAAGAAQPVYREVPPLPAATEIFFLSRLTSDS